MKKIFSCILAIIILGAMLSGCSNNDSKEMIKKAKNFSIPHEVSINSTKEDYGILAYNFCIIFKTIIRDVSLVRKKKKKWLCLSFLPY